MALCYNFTRVLNIIGFDGFMTYRPGGSPSAVSCFFRASPRPYASSGSVWQPCAA